MKATDFSPGDAVWYYWRVGDRVIYEHGLVKSVTERLVYVRWIYRSGYLGSGIPVGNLNGLFKI